MKRSSYAQIQRKILKLTNLDRVFFPQVGFTKRDLIQYYKEISEMVLPHLKNRYFTLRRFPTGVDGESFFQKECPFDRPKWVTTAEHHGVRFCVINDLPTLVWVANLAALELHTSLGFVSNPSTPTLVVFDLDPGEGAGLNECIEVAFLLKDRLKDLILNSFVKTSGKKGLHLYVPVNTPTNYEETKNFAHAIALRLEKERGDLVTSQMKKNLRTKKVFIDWSQNAESKTTVTVYSMRAELTPTVSAPVSWEELKTASCGGRPEETLRFEAEALVKRIRRIGDLFKPVLMLKQKLPPLTTQERRALMTA